MIGTKVDKVGQSGQRLKNLLSAWVIFAHDHAVFPPSKEPSITVGIFFALKRGILPHK
jgi:hypothetical protein